MTNAGCGLFVVADVIQDALAGGGSAATVARAGFASAFRRGRAVFEGMRSLSVVGRGRRAGARPTLDGQAVVTGLPGASRPSCVPAVCVPTVRVLTVCVATVRVLTAGVGRELIAAIDKRFSKV